MPPVTNSINIVINNNNYTTGTFIYSFVTSSQILESDVISNVPIKKSDAITYTISSITGPGTTGAGIVTVSINYAFTDNGTTTDGFTFNPTNYSTIINWYNNKTIQYNNPINLNGGITIIQFGGIPLSRGSSSSLTGHFKDLMKLIISASDAPTILSNTYLSYCFSGCSDFNSPIRNWDTSKCISMAYMFYNNLLFNQDISTWNVSKVTNMMYMFSGASAFNKNINFNEISGTWNVSKVTNMMYMFSGASAFNGNISDWNVSKVSTMNSMFFQARAFNQNIGNWNVSRVFDMTNLFCDALKFNQNISGWSFSNNLTNMSGMFSGASEFNQDISSWIIPSRVTNLSYMFLNAIVFNQNIGLWTIPSGVTNMSYMFNGAKKFNKNINGWNTIGVENMSYMFSNAEEFDENISGWNTSNVTNMVNMFSGATAFNQDIGNWDTSKVTNMTAMFLNAIKFNKSLNTNGVIWNTSAVTDMNSMFSGATAFNGNISHWNTSNVTNMSVMFQGAIAFNQNISGWNTSNVTDMNAMFSTARAFNQDISNWIFNPNVNISNMFNSADAFNYRYASLGFYDISCTINNPGGNINVKTTKYGFTSDSSSGTFLTNPPYKPANTSITYTASRSATDPSNVFQYISITPPNNISWNLTGTASININYNISLNQEWITSANNVTDGSAIFVVQLKQNGSSNVYSLTVPFRNPSIQATHFTSPLSSFYNGSTQLTSSIQISEIRFGAYGGASAITVGTYKSNINMNTSTNAEYPTSITVTGPITFTSQMYD